MARSIWVSETVVTERAPEPFDDLDDMASQDELEPIVKGSLRLADFARM